MVKKKKIPIRPGEGLGENREAVITESVQARLSPYDIPEEGRMLYDPEQSKFRVVFSYLTPDAPRSSKEFPKENVELKVGKKSGKIYEIIMEDVKEEEIPAVRINIMRVLGKVEEDSREKEEYVAQMNSGLIKELLDDDCLFHDLREDPHDVEKEDLRYVKCRYTFKKRKGRIKKLIERIKGLFR